MKLFLGVVALAAICSAARLDNTYLPPPNAGTAGGSGGLNPPSYGGGQGGGSGHGGGGSGGGFGGGSSGGGAVGGGAPQQPSAPQGPPIGIISYENVNNGDGTYHFSYETENGIKAEEHGEVKNKGTDNEIPSVMGSYSYTAPDGQVITVTYIADENGFQPMGDHLPTPPPIPPEIQAGLDIIAAAQANNKGGGDGGQNTGPEFGAGGFGAPNPRNGGSGGNGYPSGGPAGGGNGYPSGGPAGGGNGYPSGGPAGPRLNPGQQPQRPAPGQQPQRPAPPSAPGNAYLPPANNPQVPPPRPGGNGNFNPQSGYNY